MLQKTQSSALQTKVKVSFPNRLSAGERGLLQFAVIDDEDKTLHIACGHGTLLRELSKQHRCEMCGTTNDIEALRYARQTLTDADIIYAQPEEIPWHDESFTVLLCSSSFTDMTNPRHLLKESLRVLKPGGQMVIALPWYPAPISTVFNRMEGSNYYYSKQEAIAALEVMGFESVTWHSNELGNCVVVGWKPKYQYS